MKILVAALTIAAVFLLGTTAASAQNYPFCLRSCSYGGCTYSTMQQCQATLSGLDGWCEANPDYHQARNQANDAPPTGHARSAKRRL